MKTKKIFFASRLAIMALVCVTTFSFVSCSDSDSVDESEVNELVGTWTRQFINSNRVNVVEEYTFFNGGTAIYTNSIGIDANIKYNTLPGKIYGQIVYVYSKTKDVLRDYFSWDYYIKDDKLRLKIGIDYQTYTRKN